MNVQTIPVQDSGGNEGRRPGPDAAPSDLRGDILAVLPDLRAFARFLTRERMGADDLVQDTVVRALGAFRQFQAGTNLKAWLFTILRNLFYEQARRRKREVAALSAHGPTEEAVRPGQADASEVRDLEQALWRLSPVLREALVLVGVQEMTHDEAAAICGVPIGTMKARVSRARTELSRIMQPA